VKKSALLILLVSLATGAFALDLSAGIEACGGYLIADMRTSLASPSVSSETISTRAPFLAAAFLDATYFPGSIGYRLLALGREKSTQTISGTTTVLVDSDEVGSRGYVCFSALGRYPFTRGPVALFPILGFEYDLNVVAVDPGGNDLRSSMTEQQKVNENQFWIRGGVGAEIGFLDRMVFRPELVIGYKFNNSAENAAVESARQAGFDAALFTLSFDFRLLVGYRF
jgi:hypothetical protein